MSSDYTVAHSSLRLCPVTLALGLVLFSSCGLSARVSGEEIAELIAQLESNEPLIRRQACGKLGDRAADAHVAIPALVALLADQKIDPQNQGSMESGTIGGAARDALVRFGVAAVPSVGQAFRESTNIAQRQQAALTLARMDINSAEHVKLLARGFDDADERVRFTVVIALGDRGAAAGDALPAVQKALREDKSQWVRTAAAQYLSAIAPPGVAIVTDLRAALKDESSDVRGAAARALGGLRLAAASAVPDLIVALRDSALRQQAVSNHFAITRYVRTDVAEALGNIGPLAMSSVPALSAVLNRDDSGEVRAAAALALRRIDPENQQAIPALIELLKSGPHSNVSEACSALVELGASASAAAPALVKVLEQQPDEEDDWEWGRMQAARALAAVAGKHAIPALLSVLNENDFQLRESAIESLGELGADAAPAVDALIAALQFDPMPQDEADENFDSYGASCIRIAAAQALGKVGAPARQAIPALRKAASGEDETLQRLANKALQKIEQALQPDGEHSER